MDKAGRRRACQPLAVRAQEGQRTRARKEKQGSFIDGIGKKLDFAKLAKHDDLEHFNQFDFEERYMGLGYSRAEGTDMFRSARAGKFPPWAPSRSRNQPTVCKLKPEKISKSRGQHVEVKRRRTHRPAEEVGLALANVDGVELLLEDGGSEHEEDGVEIQDPWGEGLWEDEEQGQAAAEPPGPAARLSKHKK